MKTNAVALLFTLISITAFSCKPKMPASNAGYRSVDVTEAKQIITSDQDVVIIDVRTPGEVAEGFIPGALKINVMDDDFISKLSKLDKNKTCVVYCKSGGRSVKASKIMLDQGFKDIVNMEGGYTAWAK